MLRAQEYPAGRGLFGIYQTVMLSFLLQSSASRLGQDNVLRSKQETERQWARETSSHTDNSQLVISQIIGGEEVQRFRYSYVASLRTASGATICGGSLIAPDIVLSAAHCAGIFDHIAIGLHNALDGYDAYGVETVMQHPWYSFTDENMDINYDFLLIKLDRPVLGYEPVNLNRNQKLPRKQGDPLTVLGWGATDKEATSMSTFLQKVELEYVPNDVCEASGAWTNGQYYSYEGFIEDSMLCAWGNQKDACLGDSGGPLIIEGDDETGDIQVGVVSFGVGCANPVFPAIYARTSDQLWWIDAVICGLSIDPPSSYQCESVSDRDNDGLPDAIDPCPFDHSEGPKGAIHGCPDEDLDGIPDKDDICSGTRYGLRVSLDGCPDDSPTHPPTTSHSPAPSPTMRMGSKIREVISKLQSPYAMVGIGIAFLIMTTLLVWSTRRRFRKKNRVPKQNSSSPVLTEPAM